MAKLTFNETTTTIAHCGYDDGMRWEWPRVEQTVTTLNCICCVHLYCTVPWYLPCLCCVYQWSREMMNVRGSNLFNVIGITSTLHMMWYKAFISGENVSGSFVSSTCRDTFNVTTYDTISPLRHHEISATCRADILDTLPTSRIIYRFGTNGRNVVRRHFQLRSSKTGRICSTQCKQS